MPLPRIFSNTAVILPPLVAGVLLAASNFVLVRDNRRLANLAQHYASLRHTAEGTTVSDLRGQARDGGDITVSYPDGNRQTLLLVFSPTCPHSKRNWPAWHDLERQARDTRVVFVNVGGALPPNFSKLYSFDSATVLARTDPESILQYSFLETPLTVLVSPGGRTEKVWVGELGPSDLAEAVRRVQKTE